LDQFRTSFDKSRSVFTGFLATYLYFFLNEKKILAAYVPDDVVAKASLRIEDPLGRCPAAVWVSDDAYTFPARSGRSWTLPLPDEFHGGQEARFVQDDRLAVICTLEVLQEDQDSTFGQDFQKLLPLLVPGEDEEPHSDQRTKRHACMLPDVTFLVEYVRKMQLVLSGGQRPQYIVQVQVQICRKPPNIWGNYNI
jgi:hypothetical protein